MPPKPAFKRSTLSVDQTHVDLDNNIEVVRVLTYGITEVFKSAGITSRYNPKLPALLSGWLSVISAGLFIGIPTALKVPLRSRRPLIMVGLFFFWVFYATHKILEAKDHTILVLRDAKGRTIRITGKLCLKTGEYTVGHRDSILLQKSIGQYYNVDGDLVGENVEKDFDPLCDLVKEILESKTG